MKLGGYKSASGVIYRRAGLSPSTAGVPTPRPWPTPAHNGRKFPEPEGEVFPTPPFPPRRPASPSPVAQKPGEDAAERPLSQEVESAVHAHQRRKAPVPARPMEMPTADLDEGRQWGRERDGGEGCRWTPPPRHPPTDRSVWVYLCR